jgi:predicted nucleic acid-binding protein
LDAPSARRILARFRTHVDEGRYRILPVQVPQYEAARRWIEELSSPLRVLDALHLAVAAAHDLHVLTSDERLASAAGRVGVRRTLLP